MRSSDHGDNSPAKNRVRSAPWRIFIPLPLIITSDARLKSFALGYLAQVGETRYTPDRKRPRIPPASRVAIAPVRTVNCR